MICSVIFKKRLTKALLAFILIFILSNHASANCVSMSSNERLENYCLIQSTNPESMIFQTAQAIDNRLKREGYATGLGLPGTVTDFFFQPYVTPLLNYETNINGGNPNKPLQLGNLTFNGDPNLFRSEGVVVGAGVGAYGRYLISEGRYLDYSFGASYAHSPEHEISIQRRFATFCSKNYIINWWYIDGCLEGNDIEKTLTESSRSSINFSASKLFTYSPNTYHQISFGVNRIYDENYIQNQIQLGLNTVRNRGAYTSFNFSFGEAVPNHLAQRRSVSATLGTTVFDRALSATASYSYADGGKILGFERDEITRSITINYAIINSLSVNVGFREVDSSIDYFSEREPIVSLQFAPIRF